MTDSPPLPIPRRGLDEVLRRWSGPGELYEAIAAVEADDLSQAGRSWSRIDVERRANLMLLKRLIDRLSRWPTRFRVWIDALPAVSVRRPRRLVDAPLAGVSWAETAREGWPPRVFVVRPREREPDTVLVTTLRWTLDRVSQIRAHAVALDAEVDSDVRGQLDVGARVRREPIVDQAEPIKPTRTEIAALRREGTPWKQLADVAEVLRHLDHASLSELADELLMPDAEIRAKLFHLGVLGELLHAVHAVGGTFKSVRPLARRTRRGPAYVVTAPDGSKWDLWFEAASSWGYNRYGSPPSPYAEAGSGLGGGGGAIGADLMLIRPSERALVIECKYSARTEYVGRQAYRQVMCYALETCRMAKTVDGLVVAPTGVVAPAGGFTEVACGRVGIVPPEMIRTAVLRAFGMTTP